MLQAKTKRPAIAMIELIFAIVIMGIVLMSAPMLISTAAKSGYVAIQQEAINEAASRVNMIMGFHWDQNSSDETVRDPILQTDSMVADLAEATYSDGTLTGRRIGTPRESYRSYVGENNSRATATAIGADGGEKNDMDDFSGTIGLTLAGTGTGTNYIEKNAIITTAVIYINDDTSENNYNHSSITFNPDFDNAAGGTRNIKAINVTLTSDAASPDELNKTIILRAFSCNIGAYDLEKKNF